MTSSSPAAVLFTGVLLYAVFGGADFGSGVWDLAAGDAERGGRLRRLIDHAIGPVWEANHVWLIFVLVFLTSAFPVAFTALMQSVSIPLWLAGLGIVLRGSGFAFRKFSPSLRWARFTGIAFATSSLLTPFFLGTVAGAVVSGRVSVDGATGDWAPWLSATSILGGVLAVATCTFLAGTFLAAKADQLGLDDLAVRLARQSLLVGAATGVVVLAGIVPLALDAETFFDGLTSRGAPFIALSAGAGLASLWSLRNHRLVIARSAAVVAVTAVVLGWGAGQYPWVLVDELTLTEAAAAPIVLRSMLGAAVAVAVLVGPPLVALFRLADTEASATDGEGAADHRSASA
ncbi:MAG: cytochrome d ubiquinol oxidase subunit II [Actinomycetota bacterium]